MIFMLSRSTTWQLASKVFFFFFLFLKNLEDRYDLAVQRKHSRGAQPGRKAPSIPQPSPQPYLQSQFTAWVYLLGRKFPIRGGT